MRIGIDARSLGPTEVGPGIYARELIERLSLAAPEWEFILYVARSSDGIAPPGGANVSLRELGSPGGRKLGNLLFEQVLLPRAVSRDACDLLWSPAFVLPIHKTAPQVVTMHDAIPLLFARGTSLPRRVVYHRLLRINARRADRILTVSHSSARDLHRLLGADPGAIIVIPNGRDERYTPLGDDETPNLRALLDRLGVAAPYLLFTAGLLPRKNPHTLVDAFARAILRAGGRDLRTLVLTGRTDHGGNREYVRMLERSAAGHGIADRVRFVGFRSRAELRLLYGGAFACVDPSLYEGFGFPVTEAMACGCPVIASDRSSFPEVAGDAALFIDPESVEDLSSAIVRLAGDPELRTGLRARGLRRVLDFSWDESARRTLQSFCEVLGVKEGSERSAA